MVKHVILWTLKESLTEEQKVEIKANAKRELENLQGNIDGLVSIKLITDGLESSNTDMMLDSTLESEEALDGYRIHPMHVAAADNFVRPFTETRLCMDYEVK